MPERVRDSITEPLNMEYIAHRTAEGWVAVAVEWVRQGESAAPASQTLLSYEEVPYGQRISGDCRHLVADASEMEILLLIYEKVVAGWRPVPIALELNKRGLRTRQGSAWTAGTVFDLMPRLIELSPKLQAHPDWRARRSTLQQVVL